MTTSRVIYYSNYDNSLFLYLPRIAMIMDNYPLWKNYTDINDIIELLCIKKILEIDFETNLWSKNQKELYLERKESILRFIGKYFHEITDNNIDNIIESVENQYIHFFWQLFDSFCVYERISSDKFRKLLDESKVVISDILHSERTIKQYDEIIKNYLINHVNCAKFLITEYLEKHEEDFNHYHFPKSLTKEDKLSMVDQYIDLPDADMNVLELIVKAKENEQLKITPKIKLKAMHKYEEKAKSILTSGSSSKFSIRVIFQQMDESVEAFSQEGNNYILRYDSNWIIENQDNPTLLNNFLYLFEFTDLCFRWNHVSKQNMLGFIDLFGKIGKNEYRTGFQFKCIQMIADGQMINYDRFLSNLGISLEEIVKWFFESYIPEKFRVNGFKFNVSSSGTNYLEKCRNLCIEIDKILKYFAMYATDGIIDQELFEIKNEQMKIQEIKSCLLNKYIYPLGKDIENILHLLFSEQALMLYTEENKNHYKNSYQALIHVQIKIDDLYPHQLQSVDYLVDKKILSVDENGIITYDPSLLWLLKDLYENEVSCFYHLKKYEKYIEFLNDGGMISFDSTLLSIPEQNYFNYIFNNSEHGNALGLRNKYVHGNQPCSEEKNIKDYYTILRMLILVVMKINDEFWILFDNNLL